MASKQDIKDNLPTEEKLNDIEILVEGLKQLASVIRSREQIVQDFIRRLETDGKNPITHSKARTILKTFSSELKHYIQFITKRLDQTSAEDELQADMEAMRQSQLL